MVQWKQFYMYTQHLDSLCFDTQSRGYLCKEIPESESSIVVTGLNVMVELLDDYLQTYLEEILRVSYINSQLLPQ